MRTRKALSGRAARRKAEREARVSRPTVDSLRALLRAKGVPGEVRAAARLWLRFPETRASNFHARANALSKRRAKAKVARASRKANRS